MHRVLQEQEDDRVPAPGHRASVCMHCLRGEVVPETQHLPHVQRESGCSGASVLMTGGSLALCPVAVKAQSVSSNRP